MRRRSVLGLPLVIIALVALGPSGASSAEDDAYIVIVHPENSATTVGRDFLRDAYLKKATEWKGGDTIRPVDLTSRFAARDRFTRDVLRKTPSQLKTYWNQQIFSGKGTPPPEGDNIADVIGYVLANPGSVAYLPARTDPGQAKVIQVQ